MLRGIGGEEVFLDRYRRESQATRTAAVNVAKLQSVLDALQVFLPGTFVVLVVWLGARSAVAGEITRRRAGRVLRLLRVPDAAAAHRDGVRQQADPRPRRRPARLPGAGPRARRRRARRRRPPRPPAGSELHDARTGLRVRPGLLTAIVSRPARRLGPARRPPRALARPSRTTTSPRAARRSRRCATPTCASGSWSPTPVPPSSPVGSADRHRRARQRRRRRRRSSPRRPRTSSRRCPEGLDSVVTEKGRSLLRRPAPAAGAGPRARRRPGDPGAGRADQRGRRPHRGADRVAAARRTGPVARPSSPR